MVPGPLGVCEMRGNCRGVVGMFLSKKKILVLGSDLSFRSRSILKGYPGERTVENSITKFLPDVRVSEVLFCPKGASREWEMRTWVEKWVCGRTDEYLPLKSKFQRFNYRPNP